MLGQESELIVADNTGAKRIRVIRVLKANSNKAGLGDIVVGAVKDATPNMPVKKSEVVKAVVVRTRKRRKRKDGSWISFDQNACVIVDKDGNPKGSRVFGPIARELRDKGYMKIVSLAQEVV
jgi:large subunit ribosomal protein L14